VCSLTLRLIGLDDDWEPTNNPQHYHYNSYYTADSDSYVTHYGLGYRKEPVNTITVAAISIASLLSIASFILVARNNTNTNTVRTPPTNNYHNNKTPVLSIPDPAGLPSGHANMFAPSPWRLPPRPPWLPPVPPRLLPTRLNVQPILCNEIHRTTHRNLHRSLPLHSHTH